MRFEDTVEMMKSEDYKERFRAEYWQTKIRYERLKAFNTKIEAAKVTEFPDFHKGELTGKEIEMPKHDCPYDMLRRQQSVMGEYLHLLEMRALIEGVEL